MLPPPRTTCNEGGESDERQDQKKKATTTREQTRSGRTPSPAAGRRRLSGGGRKSPGRSLARDRSFRRRETISHHRRSAALEGEQESAPQMKRNHSFGRQLSNSSHRRSAEQEGEPQMKRNESFGKQLNLSNSSHRRKNKSPVSKRDSLPAMNGSGASESRDRNARRRKVKQTSRRASTACDLGTTQMNVFQTLERGLHCQKPSLEQSNVSESIESQNPATSKGSLSPTIASGEDSSKISPSMRRTVPGWNKAAEESHSGVSRSSDPVKLELEDGVQPRPAFGRRFSWWNLPSSGDLENLEDDDEEDLPPQVVPPSRRRSIMAEEDKQKEVESDKTLTPKQSKKAGRRSTGQKTSMRTKSNDSLDSSFTVETDAESSSGELLSPSIRKAPMNEDLVSPLPSIPKMKTLDKQLSSGTCTTESSSGSSSSLKQSKKRSSKKSRRKSVKEGSTHSRSSKAGTPKEALDNSMGEPIQVSSLDRSSHSTNSQSITMKRSSQQRSAKEGSKRNGAEKTDLDGSMRGSIGVSLEDHFNRSNRSFSRSMNRSCDFSFCSRGSTTKRSTRKSMSIKQSSLDASRSSMSMSLSGDDLSVGSDFEGSVDFDFEEEDAKDQPLVSCADAFNGEDSFQILGDESKQRDTRSRMKTRTHQRSIGGNSHSRSIRTNRQSPTVLSSEN